MTSRKLAAAIITLPLAAGLGLATLGTSPAGAATSPAAPSSAAATSGPTYVLQNSGPTGSAQSAYNKPSKFYLMRGGPDLFTTHTRWSSWGKYSASGSGTLWGVDLQRNNLGHVWLKFSDRKSNARTSSGATLSYFENVHITGGHGYAGHNWHWSWGQHNWVS